MNRVDPSALTAHIDLLLLRGGPEALVYAPGRPALWAMLYMAVGVIGLHREVGLVPALLQLLFDLALIGLGMAVLLRQRGLGNCRPCWVRLTPLRPLAGCWACCCGACWCLRMCSGAAWMSAGVRQCC